MIRDSRAGLTEYKDLLAGVAWDTGRRMNEQEKKLSEITTKLDIMEASSKPKVLGIQGARVTASDVASRTSRSEILSPTIYQVLSLVSQGSRSSAQVRSAIGKSREHTSRLLKSMCDVGYLEREGEVKAFRYTLTEKGQGVLG